MLHIVFNIYLCMIKTKITFMSIKQTKKINLKCVNVIKVTLWYFYYLPIKYKIEQMLYSVHVLNLFFFYFSIYIYIHINNIYYFLIPKRLTESIYN